jgi:ArsR family transcriptional regulator, lead/cadmium/zinc/bismuth-responsive transcriptional repressor
MFERSPGVELDRCSEVKADDVRAARVCMLDGATAKSLAGVFKALSDPTRLRIISALARREFCVGDLAAALDMEQSAVSHQLSDMRDMHLVGFRKEGRHVYYRLDDEHVRDLFAQGLAHVEHS